MKTDSIQTTSSGGVRSRLCWYSALGSCRTSVWFIVSIAVVLADQLSKYIVTLYLQPYDPLPVIPMLNLTLAYNTGAAFSFLDNSGAWHHWFFMVFTALVSIGLIVWITRLKNTERLQLLAFSLILGGAVGNLIDRFFLGYVVDFIEVYYKTHHWPIFNIADSAITIGTVLIAFDVVFLQGKK